jgi:WhiB family redox-sensing transcriptional regulator
MNVTDWDQAACRGQDTRIFFEHEDVRAARRLAALEKARKFCHQCPIKRDCLDYAVATGQQFGVWGGLTAAERLELPDYANLMPAPRRQHRAAS